MKYLTTLVFLSSFYPRSWGADTVKTEPYYNFVEPNSCQSVRKHFKVPQMPKARDQKGLSLCYGFAATALLDQYYCQLKPLMCKKGEAFFSVLDISGLAKREEIKEFGNAAQALEAVQKYGGALLEKDLPLNTLDAEGKSEGKKVIDPKAGYLILEQYYEAYKAHQCFDLNHLSLLPKYLPHLMKDLKQILIALESSQSKNDFIHKVVMPEEAKNKRYLIPKYEVNNIWGKEKFILKKSDELLSRGIPFALPHCLSGKTIKDTANCPQDKGHVVLISESMECCEGKVFKKCKKLFKLHNSFGEVWQKKNHEGWVDAAHLLDWRVNRYGLSTSNDMTWIEPAKK